MIHTAFGSSAQVQTQSSGIVTDFVKEESMDKPIANCGCWYHAEQGIPCPHDLALRGETLLPLLDDDAENCDDWIGTTMYPVEAPK